MYYVQQHPELKILTMVLSALACLHQKTDEEIDQVSFDDILRSDPLIESIDWQQVFDLVQDLEPALEEDILLDHRGISAPKRLTGGLISPYLGAKGHSFCADATGPETVVS